MKRCSILVSPLVGVVLCSALVVAQMQAPSGMPTPRLLYVMPMGGQAGSEVAVTVTGQDLDEDETLYFNFPGVKVEPLGPAVPPKKDLKAKAPKGLKGAAPITSFKFRITLPPNAPLGVQDVRVANKHGISNPRAFVIGDQKEALEQESNDDVGKAQHVAINSTINGIIATPTDVDYYQFAGKKGEHVVISCLTTSIDSKLPAALQLYTAAGTYLGFNRAYQDNDAVLDAVLPEDGEYQVRVFCFAYTLGGPDYSYRLTVSTTPWIDGVFPSIVQPGKVTALTVYGKNLPNGSPDAGLEKATVKFKAPMNPDPPQHVVLPNMYSLQRTALRVKGPAGSSNPFALTLASAPVVLEQEGNDVQESAQKIVAPCELSGRVDKKNDRDWYAFPTKKGEVYTIEVLGDRLGVPLDLYFQVRSPAGVQTTEQDDTQEILSNQFFTRSDDPPRYRLQANADGEYKVLVASRDAFTQFGPRYAYQLRILREQPDFRLIAMPPGTTQPDAANVGQGGHQVWLVHVARLDGFNGEIAVRGEGLPPGIFLKPQVVPPGQKVVPLVISAAADAKPWTGALKIVGTATINGQKIVREVQGATITWPVQALNIPAMSRIDRELVIAVRDKAPFVLTPEADKVTVQQGAKINIPVKLTRNSPAVKGAVIVTGFGLPQGMTMQPLTIAADKNTGTAVIDGKTTLQPATYTIVLRGQTGAVPKQNQQNANLGIVQPSQPVMVIVEPRAKKK